MTLSRRAPAWARAAVAAGSGSGGVVFSEKADEQGQALDTDRDLTLETRQMPVPLVERIGDRRFAPFVGVG